MTRTKSDAMKGIIAGRTREVFTHETLGCFDITGLRLMIESFGAPLHHCRYDAMRAPDGSDPFAYIVGQREIDECTALSNAIDAAKPPSRFTWSRWRSRR